MNGTGDVARDQGNRLRKITDKITDFDATFLMTKTSMEIFELLQFYTEIIEMIEEIENTC